MVDSAELLPYYCVPQPVPQEPNMSLLSSCRSSNPPMGKQWWLLLTTVIALTCFLSFLPFSSAFGVSSHAFLTVRSSREGIGRRNRRPLYLVPETTALVAAATVAATAERADVYLQRLGISLAEHGGVGILVINALLFTYYSNLKETLLSGIKGWRSDTNASFGELSVKTEASIEKLSVESKASFEKLSVESEASIEKLSVESKASIEKLSASMDASMEKLSVESKASFEKLSASIDASMEKVSASIEKLSDKIDALHSDTNSCIEKLSVTTEASIEKLSVTTEASIDKLSVKREASIEKLSGKTKADIGKLTGVK
jgi:hypothetical protein